MQQPQGLILDFDGVFYKFNPNSNHVLSHTAATAARNCGVPDTYEDLLAAFLRAGDPHAFRRQWQKQHNVDWLKYHHAYHDGIDVASINSQQDATAAFAELAARKLPMLILTHASQPWVKRVLSHIGLHAFLPDSHIIGLEHTNGLKKSESHEPIMMAAAILGINPDRLAMLEDSQGNLVHAHAVGVQTAFLNYGKPLDPQPTHVRVQAASVSSLVKGLGL